MNAEEKYMCDLEDDIYDRGGSYSDCCGVEPETINNDGSTSDYGICPACKDHCIYIDEESE